MDSSAYVGVKSVTSVVSQAMNDRLYFCELRKVVYTFITQSGDTFLSVDRDDDKVMISYFKAGSDKVTNLEVTETDWYKKHRPVTTW